MDDNELMNVLIIRALKYRSMEIEDVHEVVPEIVDVSELEKELCSSLVYHLLNNPVEVDGASKIKATAIKHALDRITPLHPGFLIPFAF